jgi:hypothetical protein
MTSLFMLRSPSDDDQITARTVSETGVKIRAVLLGVKDAPGHSVIPLRKGHLHPFQGTK